VRTIADGCIENEKYFGDLDSVVGDGDFGFSLARGFENVVAQWDAFDRSDVGTFLQKVAIVMTGRIGGTSGPIWGTAFLRAAAVAAGLRTLVTVSSYTADEDFTGASLVVSSLGDAEHPATVLADPHHLEPAGEVSLAHLTHLLTESEHPRVP